MTATQTRKPSRTAKPATGTVSVLQRLGSIPGQADAAEIAINKTPYLCRCTVHQIELVKAAAGADDEPQVYTLALDLSDCSCPDNRMRCRANGCKHRAALTALKLRGKL